MKRSPKKVNEKANKKANDEALSPFQAVQRLTQQIPRGKVATYGQLSKMIGQRLTPVGVGWALRAAKEGEIPWQRVVNARGAVSTDPHHPGLQREMLESEGVVFGDDGTIDLGRFGWAPRPPRS